MRRALLVAVVATLWHLSPARTAHAQDGGEGDGAFATIEAGDHSEPSGGGPDDEGDPPVCSRQPSQTSRMGTRTEGGYRFNYIDGMLFRISPSGEVAVRTYEVCRWSDGRVASRHYWRVVTDPDPRVLIPGTVDEVTERVFAPAPQLSPASQGVVNLGMWLAVGNGAPVTARASASPTTWAETTASLRETIFEFGNGDRVVCAGAGDPIPEWAVDSIEPSPTCGYVYTSAGGGVPYRLTITAVWSVVSTTSSGSVATGADIVLSTTIDYPVIEIQTVGTASS